MERQMDQVVPELTLNEQSLRAIFANWSDMVYRSFTLDEQTRLLCVFIDSLCDTEALEENVLKLLMNRPYHSDGDSSHPIPMKLIIQQQLLAVAQLKTVSMISEAVKAILDGNIAIFTSDCTDVLLLDLKGFEKRSIDEPFSEPTVRGPRDGFTENLQVNTSLIRRRIRTSKLKSELYVLGELTQTPIVLLYIEGLALETLIAEVRSRLKRIQIDGVLESGFIEEFIEDNPFSLFPQVQNSERPDVVCAALLEGKVAICIDNTPFALILPMTFWAGLQAAEDYYERFLYVSFIRMTRFILMLMALFFPSIYVAVTTFHPGMLPTGLLVSIASAREGVPFPSVIEAFLMEFVFEGLREASIRLPKMVGSAVSIVGALVIGQSAVQAGIIAAPMVIIVATTGIASFAIPRYNLGISLRMLRFPMLLMAGIMGFYGVVFGSIMIMIHLVCLKSFGLPYMYPVAPQLFAGFKDWIIRAPRWKMTKRPAFLSGNNKTRIPEGQRPNPENR